MAIEMTTVSTCQCDSPGWCKRHKCEKTAHWFRLCQSRPDYFQMWEEGRGPGQQQNNHHHPASLDSTRDQQVPNKKPWEYEITAAIPVFGQSESLKTAVELLQLQSERPFVTLIDTERITRHSERHQQLRQNDVEIHALCLNGVQHSEDLVAVAIDMAMTLCRTRYLLLTQAKCLFRKRTFLEEMLDLCRTKSPVVGYEIAPRPHTDWSGRVGTSCTLLDMSVMDRIGASGSFRRLMRLTEESSNSGQTDAPDAEFLFNELLEEQGVTPYLIGCEDYFGCTRDENIEFFRTSPNGDRHTTGNGQPLTQSLQQARSRISEWCRTGSSQQERKP